MGAQPLTDTQIWEVHAFLRSKTRDWLADVKGPTRSRKKINIPFEKLVATHPHPDEWLTYSGDLTGHRHSRLTQIIRDNANNLRVAWAVQLRPSTKPLSVTPIVSLGPMASAK